jgi:hypothetical protein
MFLPPRFLLGLRFLDSERSVPAWRPYAATVREDEEDPAVVAGDGGDDGWAWPWELVRWSRHLKDPAWVAGAQTHLGARWP